MLIERSSNFWTTGTLTLQKPVPNTPEPAFVDEGATGIPMSELEVAFQRTYNKVGESILQQLKPEELDWWVSLPHSHDLDAFIGLLVGNGLLNLPNPDKKPRIMMMPEALAPEFGGYQVKTGSLDRYLRQDTRLQWIREGDWEILRPTAGIRRETWQPWWQFKAWTNKVVGLPPGSHLRQAELAAAAKGAYGPLMELIGKDFYLVGELSFGVSPSKLALALVREVPRLAYHEPNSWRGDNWSLDLKLALEEDLFRHHSFGEYRGFEPSYYFAAWSQWTQGRREPIIGDPFWSEVFAQGMVHEQTELMIFDKISHMFSVRSKDPLAERSEETHYFRVKIGYSLLASDSFQVRLWDPKVQESLPSVFR